jgi:hypothetical protein
VRPALGRSQFGTTQGSNVSNVNSQLHFGVRKRKSVKAAIKLIHIGTLQHKNANNAKIQDQFGTKL